MEVTIRKMGIILPVEDKKSKAKPKHLWAIIGDHGGTMLQVYSEDYPKDWEEFFKLEKKK